MSDNSKFDTDGENAFKKDEKGKKNLMSRLSDSFKLLVAKKEDRHDAFVSMLTDETAPQIQRIAAVKQAAMQKQDSLKTILIDLVKGEYGAQEDLRIEAANALRAIGDIYNISIKSSVLIDLIELALSTIDQKLSDAIRNVFLTTEGFPYVKFIGKTLVTRFQIADEMSAEAWQVFARALSFSFYFAIAPLNEGIKNELKDLPINADKQAQSIEHMAYYVRRYIGVADDSRTELCDYIAADKNGAQIAELLAYPSLTASYHENIGLQQMLEKIYDFVLCDKKHLRDLAVSELRTINSPMVYEFCRTLILDEAPNYPDICEGLTGVLSFAAETDVSARDSFLSVVSTPPLICRAFYFSEIERLCRRNGEIRAKVVSMCKGFIKREDCSEEVVRELVTRVFPIEATGETLDFVVFMVTGKIKVSVPLAVEASSVLFKMGSEDSPYFEKVSKILRLVMKNKVPDDIKARIISECRRRRTASDLECLDLGVFGDSPKIASLAMKAYFDMSRSGDMPDKDFSALACRILSASSVLPEIISSLVSFLRNSKVRSGELRKAAFRLLSSDSDKDRDSVFSLFMSWFKSPVDRDEYVDVVSLVSSIAADPGWSREDVYSKAVGFIGDVLSSGDEMAASCVDMLFGRIRSIIAGAFPDEKKLSLCRMLEKLAEKTGAPSSAKAVSIMEGMLSLAGLSASVKLEVADFLIVSMGGVMKYFPFVAAALKSPEYPDTGVLLRMIDSGIRNLGACPLEEKIEAIKTGVPAETVRRVRFELALASDLLPTLVGILVERFREKESVKIALDIMKLLPASRLNISLISEFKIYPDDDSIRAKAIEALAELIFTPYAQEEGSILFDILKIVQDKSGSPLVRKAAISAVERIADEAFAEALIAIVKDADEKEDFRIASVRALSAMNMHGLSEVYAELLSNPSNAWPFKEAILKEIVGLADSPLTGVLLELLSSSQGLGRKLVERVLETSGYGAVARIKELDDRCESLRNRIKIIESNSSRAVAEKKTADAALQTVLGKVAAASAEVEKASEALEKARRGSADLDDAWLGDSSIMTDRIRMIAPGWPNDSHCPAEKRQEFSDLVNVFRDKKDEYEFAKESASKAISDLEAKIDMLNGRLAEIKEQEAHMRAEVDRLASVIALPVSEGIELSKKIEDAENEREELAESLSAHSGEIDSAIAAKIDERIAKRDEMDNLRNMYFNFMVRNMRK